MYKNGTNSGKNGNKPQILISADIPISVSKILSNIARRTVVMMLLFVFVPSR